MVYACVGIGIAWIVTLIAAYVLGRKGAGQTTEPAFNQGAIDAEKARLNDLWEQTSIQARAIAHRRADLNEAEAKLQADAKAAQAASQGATDADIDAVLAADGAVQPPGIPPHT